MNYYAGEWEGKGSMWCGNKDTQLSQKCLGSGREYWKGLGFAPIERLGLGHRLSAPVQLCIETGWETMALQTWAALCSSSLPMYFHRSHTSGRSCRRSTVYAGLSINYIISSVVQGQSVLPTHRPAPWSCPQHGEQERGNRLRLLHCSHSQTAGWWLFSLRRVVHSWPLLQKHITPSSRHSWFFIFLCYWYLWKSKRCQWPCV